MSQRSKITLENVLAMPNDNLKIELIKYGCDFWDAKDWSRKFMLHVLSTILDVFDDEIIES